MVNISVPNGWFIRRALGVVQRENVDLVKNLGLNDSQLHHTGSDMTIQRATMKNLNEVARKASNFLSLTINVRFDQSIEKYVVTKRDKILFMGEKQACDEFLKNNTIGIMVRWED